MTIVSFASYMTICECDSIYLSGPTCETPGQRGALRRRVCRFKQHDRQRGRIGFLGIAIRSK